MDLMYLPDAIAYPSLNRTAPNFYSYEHEEPLWTKQQQTSQGKPQQPQEKEKRTGHGGTGGCPLCKERQRRRLASYIRSKSRQDSECAIEEEEETEQPQTKQAQAEH